MTNKQEIHNEAKNQKTKQEQSIPFFNTEAPAEINVPGQLALLIGRAKLKC